MALFTRCNINLSVPNICLWSFSSKCFTDYLLYHVIISCLFRGEAETRYFHAYRFKYKWAAVLCPLFQNRAVSLLLLPQISAKKRVWFWLCLSHWNHVISESHICSNFWYTPEARAQKAAVTRHVSTKLSCLSCLIALKLSNTHKFVTHTSYKNTCLWR